MAEGMEVSNYLLDLTHGLPITLGVISSRQAYGHTQKSKEGLPETRDKLGTYIGHYVFGDTKHSENLVE